MCTCVYQWVQKYVSLLYKIRGREKYLMKYILLLRKNICLSDTAFLWCSKLSKRINRCHAHNIRVDIIILLT